MEFSFVEIAKAASVLADGVCDGDLSKVHLSGGGDEDTLNLYTSDDVPIPTEVIDELIALGWNYEADDASFDGAYFIR